MKQEYAPGTSSPHASAVVQSGGIAALKVLPSFVSLEGFLMDREAANLSPRSLQFYWQKVTPFLRFLAERNIVEVEEISPNDIRAFLVSLKANHSPGGVHAYYRAVKAFCRWLYAEGDVSRDPIRRIRPPKVPQAILEPVSSRTVQILLETCDPAKLIGARDYAIILALLDTGLRASEFLALNVGDADTESGTVKVRHTKGGRQRITFFGEKATRSISTYLEFRQVNADSPLWASRVGKRLSYTGLRDILRRRAERAGIEAPTLHSFRRAFALLCLRRGVDVYSLQRLMGHSDLSVLRRYLAQTEDDLRRAHQQANPADTFKLPNQLSYRRA